MQFVVFFLLSFVIIVLFLLLISFRFVSLLYRLQFFVSYFNLLLVTLLRSQFRYNFSISFFKSLFVTFLLTLNFKLVFLQFFSLFKCSSFFCFHIWSFVSWQLHVICFSYLLKCSLRSSTMFHKIPTKYTVKETSSKLFYNVLNKCTVHENVFQIVLQYSVNVRFPTAP